MFLYVHIPCTRGLLLWIKKSFSELLTAASCPIFRLKCSSENSSEHWQPRVLNVKHYKHIHWELENVCFIVISTSGDGGLTILTLNYIELYPTNGAQRYVWIYMHTHTQTRESWRKPTIVMPVKIVTFRASNSSIHQYCSICIPLAGNVLIPLRPQPFNWSAITLSSDCLYNLRKYLCIV